MTRRAGVVLPALHSRWWRTCIGWCVFVALAWPSLGPLPFLVHDFDAHRGDAAVHADAGAHDDDHLDASAIPGSPTHPADHNCAECEVLKHLSRCMLAVLVLAILAPVVVGVDAPRVAIVLPPAHVVAHLPPARAPPSSIA